MDYLNAFKPLKSCFCIGKKVATDKKELTYERIMQYDIFLKDTFRYYLNFCGINTFYFFLKDTADLDFVTTLNSVRMHGCGDSRIICIICDKLREEFSETDKARYDNIIENCDIKIEIRKPIYTKEFELRTIKSLIDLCPYCLFVNSGILDLNINLAMNYAKSNDKIVNYYEESV